MSDSPVHDQDRQSAQVILDVFDIWSAWAVWRHRRWRRIRYLGLAKGRLTGWLLAGLRRQGFIVEECMGHWRFAQRAEHYVQVNVDTVNFLESSVAPAIRKSIAGLIGFDDRQRERIVRFVIGRRLQVDHLAIEAVDTVRLNPDDSAEILLHHNGNKDALSDLARHYGLGCHFYRAPFRWSKPRRQGFANDFSDVDSVLCGVYQSAIATASLVRLWLAACWRRLRPAIPAAPVEIVGIDYGRGRNPRLHEFHWVNCHPRGRRFKVLAGYLFKPDGKLEESYQRLRLQSFPALRPSAALFGKESWWRSAASRLTITLPAQTVSVFKLLSSGMSFWQAGLILRFLAEVAFFDALLRACGAKVVFSAIEGAHLPSSALATAAIGVGGVSTAYTWSTYNEPHSAGYIINRADIMLSWGSRQDAVLGTASRALVDRFVHVGYPGTREQWQLKLDQGERPAWYADLLRQTGCQQVVCFYDTVQYHDIVFTLTEAQDFYHQLFRWLERRPDVVLIIKSKRGGIPPIGAAGEEYRRLCEAGRLVLRTEAGDLETGLAADAVLGISILTLSSLALALGRPGVVYDPTGIEKRYPAGFPHAEIIAMADQLGDALDRALAEPHLPRLGRGTPIDAFADLDAESRIADAVGQILDSLDQGFSPIDAIKAVDLQQFEDRKSA